MSCAEVLRRRRGVQIWISASCVVTERLSIAVLHCAVGVSHATLAWDRATKAPADTHVVEQEGSAAAARQLYPANLVVFRPPILNKNL